MHYPPEARMHTRIYIIYFDVYYTLICWKVACRYQYCLVKLNSNMCRDGEHIPVHCTFPSHLQSFFGNKPAYLYIIINIYIYNKDINSNLTAVPDHKRPPVGIMFFVYVFKWLNMHILNEMYPPWSILSEVVGQPMPTPCLKKNQWKTEHKNVNGVPLWLWIRKMDKN